MKTKSTLIRALILATVSLGASLNTAQAEPMSAAEFDAYSQGKTLYFGRNGAVYGAEIYLPDRRVKWSFLDGDCKDGLWYEDAGNICFIYEDREDPQCWTFELGGRGLIAQFQGREPSVDLYEATDIQDEMVCLGPKVGV